MSQQRSERPVGSSPDFPDLPDATVARLPEYLRALHVLAEAGHDVVSSEELATAAGVNSAKLRKDLSYLRSNGTRGVGYDVSQLIDKIEYVLGLTQHRAVALVGVGNLGHALAGYAGSAPGASTSPRCSTPIPPGSARRSTGWPYGTSTSWPRWSPPRRSRSR